MTDLYTPDFDWLITAEEDQLHHATLTRERAKECEERGGIYDEPVRFDCGLTATTALIPDVFSRGGFGGGLPRCLACCEATGLPHGTGSPKNNPECRAILGMDEVSS